MQSTPLKIAALALFGAMVVSGCRCGETTITKKYGEIGVVVQVGETTQTSRDAVYDFGAVFMGQPKTQTVTIRNLGAGALTLSTLEKTEGVEVVIGETATGENPIFNIPFVKDTELGASEVATIEVTYNAPMLEQSQIDHEVKLLLRAGNTSPDEEGSDTAVITLKARAVNGVCKLPEEIDFGNVIQDDVGTQKFTIRNPTDIAAEASIGDITSGSGDHEAFAFAPESIRGTAVIDPDTERDVALEFRPTTQKSYLAVIRARASAQCPEQNIRLVGTGVGSVLTWDPSILDFKYVTPGVQVTKEVTFSNAGPTDAQLSQIKPLNMQEFWVVAAAGADATKLSVPKAVKDQAGKWVPGTAKLTVAFKPVQLGPRQTQLQFQTSLAKQQTGFVTLKGFGGGPDIQVTPSPTLNFGKVAYFANSGSFQKRKLTIMNVGTAPAVTDPAANLRLGKDAGNGDWTGPYYEIVALNADTDPTEFEVIVPPPPTYDPAVGLEAKAGKNKVDFEVKITPASVALKQATLRIFSNDPDQPAVEILLSADAVNLPPCQYEVTPTQLSFGLISPPDYRDLSFQIRNNGTGSGDICLLSSLDIASGSHEAFSLVDGPVASEELAPGATKQIKVRVHPQGTTPVGVTNIQGVVDFFMSSPNRPQAQVSLNAQLAPSCLTIAPDELDFGTVKVGCSSATRSFLIYNTCTSPVTITNFGMQNAGGQPAGGPNCPGGAPCPEYHAVQSLPIPAGGLVLSAGATPQQFQIKYRPIDIGSDTGAVAINATQNGTNVTYVVALTGKGDTVGIQTDVFMQDAKPKADILLVIDNSGSMGDEQASLATNFGSFIKYANSAKVDYHIAVTTSDMGAEGGRFVFGTGHAEKVLTPTTFDVENKFKAKVNVGTNGSATEMCFEPALKGLTAPLVNSDNAGFLRNEAALAIVCITDENEQSPQSVTYYQNAFFNIKGHNRKTMFTLNAISGFTPACSYDDGSLAQMVAATNGVKEDICAPDWSVALEKLGQTAFGFRTNFFLTSVPDLSIPIEVVINGTSIPAVDNRGANVWVYDSVSNSVNFEPMYVPEPGQTMTITYRTTCYEPQTP